ncbi:hypothetical protein HA402_010365 [Bradysia odoriphaga]|nr:hypothetical protein HA402_010365 [Bradysia odoriphaga]
MMFQLNKVAQFGARPKKPRPDENEDSFIDSDHEEEFYYTEVEDDDQDESSPSPPSPPTLSHRDMARPPHEDPEYQRQLVGSFRQGLLSLATQKPVKPPLPMSIGGPVIPTSPIAHHNYTWAHQNPMSPQKHVRLSPRPSTSYAPYPSPTYTNAIAAAQHNVHIALGTTPNNLHNGHQLNGVGGGPLNLSHSAPNHHHHHLQQLQQNRSPVSPNRRTRGENKKCRKVYGMDNKEAWCTQCKWKKACSRFGD